MIACGVALRLDLLKLKRFKLPPNWDKKVLQSYKLLRLRSERLFGRHKIDSYKTCTPCRAKLLANRSFPFSSPTILITVLNI